MKLSFQVLLFCASLLAGLAIYVYFSVLRPAHRLIEQTKPAAVERAKELVACLDKGEVPACSYSLSTPDFQTLYPPELLGGLAEKWRSQLGTVLASRLDEQSFSAMENRHPGEKIVEIDMRLLVQFSHAGVVPVAFTLVRRDSGALLVSRLSVDSPSFLTP